MLITKDIIGKSVNERHSSSTNQERSY